MGNRRISDDLKRPALRMRACGRYTDPEVIQVMGISRSTLFRTAHRMRRTGSVAKAVAIGPGRPRKLMHADCPYLLALARHKPSLFLDQYAARS